MYIYIYTYIHIYIYIYIYIHTHTRLFRSTCVYICIHTETHIHTKSHARDQCIVAAQRYLRDCATSDSDSISHQSYSDSELGAHKRATGIEGGEDTAAVRHADIEGLAGHRMCVRMIRDMLFGRSVYLSVCLSVCLPVCLYNLRRRTGRTPNVCPYDWRHVVWKVCVPVCLPVCLSVCMSV